ncbi:MAG: hypothetical protein IPJ65_21600 [Archangiaceae bacterium]|nr:hypothetical protein [Archangiaceae bacterium]
MHALVLFAALAQLDTSQQLTDARADASRVTVYGYPLGTLALAARGLTDNEYGLELPLGVSIRLTERTSLDLEAMWVGLVDKWDGRRTLNGFGVSFAAGPKVSLWRGLWADLHARFTLTHPVQSSLFRCPPDVLCALSGPLDLGPGYTRAFLAEADVGYEWRFGALYLSPTVGIGAGYAYDYLDSTGLQLLSPFSRRTTARTRTEGFVWTLNLNLLRVGFSL